MRTFIFPGDEIQRLIEDALAHDDHYLTIGQRLEFFGPEAWNRIDGEEKDKPAGLWLVKDEGVYLMSNSYPNRAGPIYADGYGPAERVGGDDFVEFLSPELFGDKLTESDVVGITLKENTIDIMIRRVASY